MLRKMNRWYTREEYIDLTSKLKAQISNLTISTDIIVGFCGRQMRNFRIPSILLALSDFQKRMYRCIRIDL